MMLQEVASHGRRDESPLNITPGSGKSLPPNCAEKHMVTPGPGFGIRDLLDQIVLRSTGDQVSY